MNALRVTLRVDFDTDHAIGPGKVALLEKMHEAGSLSQAARDLHMSYRRAWQLLDNLNRSFRTPLVKTSVGGAGGGGAELTDLGQAVITAYRKFEQKINTQAASHFEAVARKVATDTPAVRRSISKTHRAKSGLRAVTKR
jgi:molybdate transport system regulatory protein